MAAVFGLIVHAVKARHLHTRKNTAAYTDGNGSISCIRFSIWLFVTHMLEEDAEFRVGLWVDGGLEDGKENVLQHLAKVGDKVSAPEDVT